MPVIRIYDAPHNPVMWKAIEAPHNAAFSRKVVQLAKGHGAECWFKWDVSTKTWLLLDTPPRRRLIISMLMECYGPAATINVS